MISQSLKNNINKGQEFFEGLIFDQFKFYPAHEGLTTAGKELRLGFSCYGLKYYYMSGKWDKLDSIIQENWVNYLNSFQSSESKFPNNSYLDNQYLKYLNKFSINKFVKEQLKKTLNITGLRSFETKKSYEKKSINAETKQAIATLHQVGFKNEEKIDSEFNSDEQLYSYLSKLDWSKPWASGAQFSSLCVFSATQGYNNIETLIKFSNTLVDKETGFYFGSKPVSNREMFNGAMKMISGFDWIEIEIHYPEKIIDFCLSNEPIFEGCDFVDYIYVLNKCSNQTSYKKKEIITRLTEIYKNMSILYHENLGGYSYFVNKSQTHYYGVEITKGYNTPDIHATLLCNWANILILDTIGELDGEFKTIKP